MTLSEQDPKERRRIEVPRIERLRIEVEGVVQGVGFRPFVYKLARAQGLAGFVFNSPAGVTIEVEGCESALCEFLLVLKKEPPRLAEIANISVVQIEVAHSEGFHIEHSREREGASASAAQMAQIPPDVGTCDACWSDFGDRANRRFGYPFTNCTHCGPRYSIIREVPYDRPLTTMATFTMCADCETEYLDPGDRRFHAQPNACAVCGPSLRLLPAGADAGECSFADKDSLTVLRALRSMLQNGKIVAVKGLGGFLLACDARNQAAVAELRRRKRRRDKPFALMARDVATVRKFCEVSSEEEAALEHPRRPIVVLRRLPGANLAAGVAPDNPTVGFMLPYTPLHYLLFSDSAGQASDVEALVMTSGNLSEEPIVISNEDAMTHLAGIADFFLLHNREIASRVDDSVVRVALGRQRVLRRSRGFAPQTIDLGLEMNEVLAFGAELKNTFCLTRGRYAILSQHIGDLENYETEQFFEETLAKMQRAFRITPRVAAYDLHPGYMSTRLAFAANIERKIAVQHHHAHIASCMAENHLRDRVIGVAMDGTGYGTDGAIWGCEFLIADYGSFERRAHLRYVRMAGGDEGIREPWYSALAHLRDSFGEAIPQELACFDGIASKRFDLVNAILGRDALTVQTSSCGRLFDAVASLLGLAQHVTFEGQAAIALENIALGGIREEYPFEISETEPMVVDLRSMLPVIVTEIQRGRPAGEISARFHNTVSAYIAEVCGRMRASDGLDRVCLSGGTFQNVYLLERTVALLQSRGFGVFLHSLVPANDGGIALGQAVIANEAFRRA